MAKKSKIRGLSGTTSSEVQPFEIEHRRVARRAAAASVVLLKNEGHLLPIAPPTSVALYGAGAGFTVKGGTGSGDVNERYSVTLAEGLRYAGYRVTTEDWIADYERRYRAARLAWRDKIWAETDRHPEDDMALFTAYAATPFVSPAGSAAIKKTDTDTAIYVLSRVAGEGADRRAGKGDYELSDDEAKLVEEICAVYPDVVLVLNTGGPVDLSFTDLYPNIRAILQISQLGCEGGNGFADVLSGAVTPAGKLTDTWAYRYEDYPSSAVFSHNDGDVNREPYIEGIYVGYRYFDTFEVPVRYGFGYGISYTNFDLSNAVIRAEGADRKRPEIRVNVTVTNTGDTCSGREVVQVYVSCPQDGQPKEYRRLAAFGKTSCLAPGEPQDLELRFTPREMASYCAETSGWALEKGIYGVFLGSSLGDARLIGTIEVPADQLLVRTEHICPLQEPLEELASPAERLRSRRAVWISAPSTEKLPKITLDPSAFRAETVEYGGEYDRISEDVKVLAEELTEDQLVKLVTGDPNQGMLSGSLGAAGFSVPGSAAQSSGCAREQGLPDIVFADGPAGIRINKSYFVQNGAVVPEPFEKGLEGGFLLRGNGRPEGREYFQYCTAFPVGTALAQSWDPDLVAEVGCAVAEEMQRCGITSWLAPGMNIHRNPLCGRNFEYYAEDPLLTGKIAAAMVRGVQSRPGCGCTVKHFACNNQEDNRMGSDSVLSERTLREIYLKGFEIAVREAQPHMIMTSYNKINGVHTANLYDLCTKIARDEWGFRGFIMTDWTTTHQGPDCTAAGCIRAGNDMIMPGRVEDQENIREALHDGSLSLRELLTCVGHIAGVVLESDRYEQ